MTHHHQDTTREVDPNLIVKRSWDFALGPIKQVHTQSLSSNCKLCFFGTIKLKTLNLKCDCVMCNCFTGAHESIPDVHGRQLHINFPHHDGRHVVHAPNQSSA